jgi:putative RecB family exonuclease
MQSATRHTNSIKRAKYSHSRIKTYEECPLKYKLRYIDGIKRYDIEGVEAFLGSRVHETLEKLYDDMKLSKLNTLEEITAYYEKLWKQHWNDNVFIAQKGFDQKHYKELGRQHVKAYYKRYHPFDQSRTIATEMSIEFPLDEAKQYLMIGKIDRVALDSGGVYEAHDYKTSGYLPTQEEIDNDRQLGVYHLGIKKNWPDAKNIVLIWHFLTFDKEMTSARKDATLERLRGDIISLIKEIESLDLSEFKPKESALCNWCEYQDLCPKKKHKFCLSNLSENQYLKEPGVKLVNEYASLKAEVVKIKKKHDQELEAYDEKFALLEEAILRYAEKNKVEVITARDFMIKVKMDKKIKFPGKSDKARPQLEYYIKEAGKWNEVSTLDTKALEEIVKKQSWGKELREKIMEYGKIEDTHSVRLVKNARDDEDE